MSREQHKQTKNIHRHEPQRSIFFFWSLENSWTRNSNGEYGSRAIQLYSGLPFSEYMIDCTLFPLWSWAQPNDLIWTMEYKQTRCAFFYGKKLLKVSVQVTMFPLFPQCANQQCSCGASLTAWFLEWENMELSPQLAFDLYVVGVRNNLCRYKLLKYLNLVHAA